MLRQRASRGSSCPEPYELRLSDTPRTYRQAWGVSVVQQLEKAAGPLTGKTIEVHAGAAYTDAIRDRLREAGARVLKPLTGLTLGQRLAWYGSDADAPRAPEPAPVIDALIERLRDQTTAQTPAAFLTTQGTDMQVPGLYSWWVDNVGAQDLTKGLEVRVEPGLIYAGLAGATRSLSGKKSTNTLWGRIRGMHLGGNPNFSTFKAQPRLDPRRRTQRRHHRRGPPHRVDAPAPPTHRRPGRRRRRPRRSRDTS